MAAVAVGAAGGVEPGAGQPVALVGVEGLADPRPSEP